MSPISGTFPALLLMVPREGASAGMVFLLNIAAFIAIFYFLLIRPQRQEAKRHQEMLASLKKGDEIVTSGGAFEGEFDRFDSGWCQSFTAPEKVP